MEVINKGFSLELIAANEGDSTKQTAIIEVAGSNMGCAVCCFPYSRPITTATEDSLK